MVNTGSGNGLLPGSTKPLPEPVSLQSITALHSISYYSWTCYDNWLTGRWRFWGSAFGWRLAAFNVASVLLELVSDGDVHLVANGVQAIRNHTLATGIKHQLATALNVFVDVTLSSLALVVHLGRERGRNWTHCGLVTPWGDINLGQHWLR